jgi:hypothetical protein
MVPGLILLLQVISTPIQNRTSLPFCWSDPSDQWLIVLEKNRGICLRITQFVNDCIPSAGGEPDFTIF